MARERSVTRTINVTTVNAITMDIESKNVETKAFTISGDTPSQDSALKQAKKLYETSTLKIVAIESMTTVEKLYGMSEVEFLKYAKELDPQTRKALNQFTIYCQTLHTYMVCRNVAITLQRNSTKKGINYYERNYFKMDTLGT